jgi:hypothetical protein
MTKKNKFNWFGGGILFSLMLIMWYNLKGIELIIPLFIFIICSIVGFFKGEFKKNK